MKQPNRFSVLDRQLEKEAARLEDGREFRADPSSRSACASATASVLRSISSAVLSGVLAAARQRPRLRPVLMILDIL